MLARLQEAARAAQVQGGKEKPSQKFDEVSDTNANRTASKVAEMFGTNREYTSKAVKDYPLIGARPTESNSTRTTGDTIMPRPSRRVYQHAPLHPVGASRQREPETGVSLSGDKRRP